MLKGTIVLISGALYSIVLGLFCVVFVDRIFPLIATYCPVAPTDPLYAVYGQLELLCLIILFIPLECVGLALIYFYLRMISREREEVYV
jgi:hypothetical protein